LGGGAALEALTGCASLISAGGLRRRPQPLDVTRETVWSSVTRPCLGIRDAPLLMHS
jgi:hypothetical protein